MKVSSPVVSITALGETAGTQSRAGRRLLSTNIAIKTIFIKFAKTIFIIIGKKMPQVDRIGGTSEVFCKARSGATSQV